MPQTPPQTQAPADTDAVRAGATDLGDITGLGGPAFPTGRLDGGADAVDYYRFTLSEAKGVHFGLRQQETNADLILEDEGGVGHREHDHGREPPTKNSRGRCSRARISYVSKRRKRAPAPMSSATG